jgi:hypothetical protein
VYFFLRVREVSTSGLVIIDYQQNTQKTVIYTEIALLFCQAVQQRSKPAWMSLSYSHALPDHEAWQSPEAPLQWFALSVKNL